MRLALLAILLVGCGGQLDEARPDPSRPVHVYANKVQGDLEALKLQAAEVSSATGWDVRAVVACGRCDPNQLAIVPADVGEDEVEPAEHRNDCPVLRVARGQTPSVAEPIARYLGPNRTGPVQ